LGTFASSINSDSDSISDSNSIGLPCRPHSSLPWARPIHRDGQEATAPLWEADGLAALPPSGRRLPWVSEFTLPWAFHCTCYHYHYHCHCHHYHCHRCHHH
jgi:hypothetical protein